MNAKLYLLCAKLKGECYIHILHVVVQSSLCFGKGCKIWLNLLNKAKILRVELGKFWYKDVNYVFWFFMLVEGVEKNWNWVSGDKKVILKCKLISACHASRTIYEYEHMCIIG